jgi:hypothetical protein
MQLRPDPVRARVTGVWEDGNAPLTPTRITEDRSAKSLTFMGLSGALRSLSNHRTESASQRPGPKKKGAERPWIGRFSCPQPHDFPRISCKNLPSTLLHRRAKCTFGQAREFPRVCLPSRDFRWTCIACGPRTPCKSPRTHFGAKQVVCFARVGHVFARTREVTPLCASKICGFNISVHGPRSTLRGPSMPHFRLHSFRSLGGSLSQP